MVFQSHSPHRIRCQVPLTFLSNKSPLCFTKLSLLAPSIFPEGYCWNKCFYYLCSNNFNGSHDFECAFLRLPPRPSCFWLRRTCLTWFPPCVSASSWSFHEVTRCQPIPLCLGSWTAIHSLSCLCLSKPHSSFKATSLALNAASTQPEPLNY